MCFDILLTRLSGEVEQLPIGTSGQSKALGTLLTHVRPIITNRRAADHLQGLISEASVRELPQGGKECYNL